MQKVFYKIKFKDFSGNDIERIHTDINEAKKDYNTMNEMFGVSDVRFFIINENEEELLKDQIP